MKTKAMFYEKHKDKIYCFLCPHNCMIEKGNFGKCKVRVHEDGALFTINYGEITSSNLDPIEKKPLYYFNSGTYIFSVGSFGCNFTCSFCQNYPISQYRAQSDFMPKEDLVRIAIDMKQNIGLAFTYNEPTIWYEYVYDTAKYLKEKDRNKAVVLVTNGYISEEPLKQLMPYVDAMNIDLKSFREDYYKSLCGGRLSPVLKTIETASNMCHVEVTTLLVSEKNDTIEEVEAIAKFLMNIDPDIPLHLSRYFPMYQMETPPTDLQFMHKAYAAAKKYLNRVNLGNV